jgi:heme a synthase
MNTPHRHFHRLAWLAVALALGVIVFGAFVRLSHAGLSCPDWPTCYGRATWPVQPDQVAAANEAFPQRAVDTSRAWREKVHRHAAAVLGLLVATLALLAARQRQRGVLLVLGAGALVGAAIGLYMAEHYVASSLLVAIAEAGLLLAAWRWRERADFTSIALVTLAVIVFQAMLGLWTVTWLLKPVVVMAHLMGGLTTFSLLVWMAWRSTPRHELIAGNAPFLRRIGIVGLVLLAVQIALGGWVSANYAALACGTDFPTCLGRWWPETDFREAFLLWRGIGVDYEGGLLDGPARAAIQISHRLFALVVLGHLLFFALRLRPTPGLGGWGWGLGAMLGLQVGIGIANVVFALPLWLATAHNAGAVLLLFLLISLLARLRSPAIPP